MYAYIFDSKDGELLETYVADDDLSPYTYAHKYADSVDCTIDDCDGDIPDGSGDIEVRVAEEPHGVSVWRSQSFYLNF
jgi:hypothetical protein